MCLHQTDPEFGDDHTHDLTKEFVGKYARDNLIVVTWANHAYLDFVLNWAGHLRDLGVTNFLVGAMDKPLMDELIARKV